MLRRVAGRDGHDIELEMHCSETGMLVATASVPLRGIPRQQRMVSRSEREVNLTSFPWMRTDIDLQVPCCGLAHTQGAPNVLGWLQVVIENCGSRECGQLGHSHPDLVPSPAGGYAQCREGGRQHRAAPGRKNTRVKARRLPWPGTAPNATHDAVKYFADQREKSRLQLVQRRMRETLLERRYLPAVAGEASYFTVPFTSPLPVEALYSVQLGRVGTQGGVAVEGTGRCGLSLVTDPAEWRYLVTSQGFTEPDCGYELFIATSEFLLRPGQTVELPFRFLSFLESAEDLVYDISIRRSGGDTVRVVELVVPGPLGFLVNQVARYWEPERAALRKTLLLKGEIETEPVLVISPEDSGVSVTTQDQPGQLFISLVAPRFTEGPREAVCVVYARGDNYREQPLWVVRIVCYGLLGEYVKGVVGQHFEKIIQLPPQLHQGAPTMVAYSSNPSLAGIELSCVPVPEYGPCHIPLSILPSASGMSSCLVFAAVAGSVSGVGRPGAAWILNIQAEPPTVTETHELALAYGQQCRKRLPFRNPLTRQTEFTVRSSDPEILQVASTSLKLAPLTASHVDLVFRPVQGHMRRKSECFLFISTSDGQVSDTRLFKLSYTPDWPGPPEPKRAPVLTATIDDPMEDRSEPSATRGRSISRPRTADQQPRSAVQLELVLDNSSVVSVSSTRVEDLVRTALTSAARLPPSMLHVSKWVADYLFVGMGSLLRDRAADFTFRQIERSSSQRVTPFIWAAASRSDGYPGEHVVTLVAKRCGVFEAPDVARILRTSVEDSSSLLKRKGGLLASLFEGARVEIGDRVHESAPKAAARLRSASRNSRRSRSQTPSQRWSGRGERLSTSGTRTRSQPRPPNKRDKLAPVLAESRGSSLADDFAAELEAWGKSSMAHLLESRTALRQPPVRGSVNVKHSSSGSMQTKVADDSLSRILTDELLGTRNKYQSPHSRSGEGLRKASRERHGGVESKGHDARVAGLGSLRSLEPDDSVLSLPGPHLRSDRSLVLDPSPPSSDGESSMEKIYAELMSLESAALPLTNERGLCPDSMRDSEPSRPLPYPRELTSTLEDMTGLVEAHLGPWPTDELPSLEPEASDNSERRRSYGELKREAVRHSRDSDLMGSQRDGSLDISLDLGSNSDAIVSDSIDHKEGPDSVSVRPSSSNSSDARSSEQAEASSEPPGDDAAGSAFGGAPSERSKRTPSTSVVSAARKSQIIDMLLNRPSRQIGGVGTGSQSSSGVSNEIGPPPDALPVKQQDRASAIDTGGQGVQHAGADSRAAAQTAVCRSARSGMEEPGNSCPGGESGEGDIEDTQGKLSPSVASPPSRESQSGSAERLVPVRTSAPTAALSDPVQRESRDDTGIPPSHPASILPEASTSKVVPASSVQSQTSVESDASSSAQSPQERPQSIDMKRTPIESSPVDLWPPSVPDVRRPSLSHLLPGSKDAQKVTTWEGAGQVCNTYLAPLSRSSNDGPQGYQNPGRQYPAFSPPSPEKSSSEELPLHCDPSWLTSPLGSSMNVLGHTVTSVDAEGDGEASWAVAATDPYRLQDGSLVWQCVVRSLRLGISSGVSSVGLGIGLCSNPIGTVGCTTASELPSSVMLGYECTGVFVDGALRTATNVAHNQWAQDLKAGDIITLVLDRGELQVWVNWTKAQSEMLQSNPFKNPHLVVELVGAVASISLHGHDQIKLSAHRLKAY
ncbi:Nephronophthisis 4 [Perkinsus olseni]|uniref:Nephronophthisis 4 n=1 Tax=Perkinsus olseni TaxID=32597 RepID=A0A7J6T8K3_PEROL|nr:Nephronophthisis 4 [Perkinsus olseni]